MSLAHDTTDDGERDGDEDPEEQDHEDCACVISIASVSARIHGERELQDTPNGTAPADDDPIKNRLIKNMNANTNLSNRSNQLPLHALRHPETNENTHAGNTVAVKNTFLCQSFPPILKNTLVEIYPPIPPEKVQKMIITVASEPRFEGDRKPARANTMYGGTRGVR